MRSRVTKQGFFRGARRVMPLWQNVLYKNHCNRYLIRRRLKPVTICIAAICNVNQPDVNPTIVFCADRLVSAGIQFEGGESKIKRITDYCYAMQSSTDSLVSDLILEKVREKTATLEKPQKIEDIVKMIRAECIAYRKEWIEDAILSDYNMIFDKLGVKPDSILHKASNEVRDCEYPYEFQYIVLGIEPTNQAHIFVIDQEGRYRMFDSLGFAAIGTGYELAFIEMTKYMYARTIPVIGAIPRVYIAKKVSERAQGVGRATDLVVLFYGKNPKEAFSPAIQVLSAHELELLPKLETSYETIVRNEASIIDDMAKTVFETLAPKKQPVEQSSPQPEEPHT